MSEKQPSHCPRCGQALHWFELNGCRHLLAETRYTGQSRCAWCGNYLQASAVTPPPVDAAFQTLRNLAAIDPFQMSGVRGYCGFCGASAYTMDGEHYRGCLWSEAKQITEE